MKLICKNVYIRHSAYKETYIRGKSMINCLNSEYVQMLILRLEFERNFQKMLSAILDMPT